MPADRHGHHVCVLVGDGDRNGAEGQLGRPVLGRPAQPYDGGGAVVAQYA
ncbi:hypothetical protein ACWEFL_35175 [Streptomyces sp. NPDC004838]